MKALLERITTDSGRLDLLVKPHPLGVVAEVVELAGERTRVALAKQRDVVRCRAIPGVLQFGRRANEPSPEHEVHARLQVCEIRHGHEQ